MSDYRDVAPAYRTIRISLPDDAAAEADAEAWERRGRYPSLQSTGVPGFGVVREREEGGWEVLSSGSFAEHEPQGARDSMAWQLRRFARLAARDGNTALEEEYAIAAERLEWEKLDELTVEGLRFRVARCESFVAFGPEGPEPPRRSDQPFIDERDAERDARYERHRISREANEARMARGEPWESGVISDDEPPGFVLDTVTPTGMTLGILKTDLLQTLPPPGSMSKKAEAALRRAMHSHPGGALLPVMFMLGERVGKRWRQESGHHDSPRDAREQMLFYLREFAPKFLRLKGEELAAHLAAAVELEACREDRFDVMGRHFAVGRVERLVRFGPDGPEGPRPEDPDPQLPNSALDMKIRRERLAAGLPEFDESDDRSRELPEDVDG